MQEVIVGRIRWEPRAESAPLVRETTRVAAVHWLLRLCNNEMRLEAAMVFFRWLPLN